jgi:protein-S-isoprenylcysteine O-methyltransferase Ste14
MGELLGLAIAMRSVIAGPLAVVGFAFILMRRIGVEERALGQREPSAGGIQH